MRNAVYNSIIGGDKVKYVLMIVLIIVLFFGGCTKKDENIKKEKYIEVEKTFEPKSDENSETQAPVETEKPTEQSETVLIAEGQTTLYDNTENRINNIKIAASAINGYRIAPYGTFSFNEVVGERTAEKGYKQAPILLYGEREYDYGGGVCQVSTTLCMAACNAGFEIKERHSHKKEVDYAKKGEDAAVDYGSLDFKFINNSNVEIVVYAGVYDNYVVVQLYR